MTIIPSFGWLLVKLNAISEVTDGGIIIPVTVLDREKTAEDSSQRTFTVLATPSEESLGISQDGVDTVYPKDGDIVYVMGKNGGFFPVGNERFLVRLDTIMGVVDAD